MLFVCFTLHSCPDANEKKNPSIFHLTAVNTYAYIASVHTQYTYSMHVFGYALQSVYSFLVLGTYFIHDALRATLHILRTHTHTLTFEWRKKILNSISYFTGINFERNVQNKTAISIWAAAAAAATANTIAERESRKNKSEAIDQTFFFRYSLGFVIFLVGLA